MKTKPQGFILIGCAFFFLLFLASCNKENSSANTGTFQAVVSATQSIAVAAGSTSNDSIYVIHACDRGHILDSIAASTLPTTITDYLAANYAGYTFQKAYTEKDASGNITGYVAIIQFNGNPVGLKFDASGNFILVLEQREGRDLNGDGWHKGGRFCNRDGRHNDTVALTSLPADVLSYFASNYPQDTLIRVYLNRDSSYTIFSEDKGASVTVFNSTGTFVKRVQLKPHTNGNVINVSEDALPAVIQTYLGTTYPNFVFDQAFSFSENGTLLGYVVAIDANGNKYAVAFDASGNFIRAITIR
ncbi:MAG TPA: PepSY-like domain-containing protein [Ginsengibacter sp.]